jgi:hypothetical protein
MFDRNGQVNPNRRFHRRTDLGGAIGCGKSPEGIGG